MPKFQNIILFLLLMLFFIPDIFAKNFNQNGWSFIYPDTWYVKVEDDKITVSPTQNFSTAPVKLILSCKKLSDAMCKKYNEEKLLELSSLTITSGEQDKMMQGSANVVEERTIRRPKPEDKKTARDKENDKKWEEERKAQKAKQQEAGLELQNRFKIIAKKNETFLGQKGLYLEFELKPKEEWITKKYTFAVLGKTLPIVVAIAPKEQKNMLTTLEKIQATIVFKQ